MRTRYSWALIVVALAVLAFAIAALIDLSRNQQGDQKEEALVSLSASPEQVGAGDDLTLTIYVQNVADAYGSSIRLTFDPQALEVIPQDDGVVVPGDFFASQPSLPVKNSVDSDTGIIEYALTLRQPAVPVTGGGALGTVQMRVLQDLPAFTIDIAEAQLLSPQFENVEGRMVATQVLTIPVKMQGITLSSSAPSVATSPSETVPAEPQQPRGAQLVDEIVSRFGDRSSPGIIAGAIFFLAGLILFLFGLRTYARFHRRYST